jgi:heat shock protein HslJ
MEANGISTDSAQTRPYIHFTDSGAVNGNASVNTFFGRYTTNGDTLSLYEMGATMMMGEHMEVESAIMEALGKTVTFELEDSTLSVKDALGNMVMTLVRK